jgi:hypothetical protein
MRVVGAHRAEPNVTKTSRYPPSLLLYNFVLPGYGRRVSTPNRNVPSGSPIEMSPCSSKESRVRGCGNVGIAQRFPRTVGRVAPPKDLRAFSLWREGFPRFPVGLLESPMGENALLVKVAVQPLGRLVVPVGSAVRRDFGSVISSPGSGVRPGAGTRFLLERTDRAGSLPRTIGCRRLGSAHRDQPRERGQRCVGQCCYQRHYCGGYRSVRENGAAMTAPFSSEQRHHGPNLAC